MQHLKTGKEKIFTIRLGMKPYTKGDGDNSKVSKDFENMALEILAG